MVNKSPKVPGAPVYEETVRSLHLEALRKVEEGRVDFENEPAPERVLEALRRCLDEGALVPLLNAFLEASGRGSDAEAVRLFEGWLRSGSAREEIESLFFGGLSRAEARAFLARLRKAAARGRNALIGLRA